MEGTLPLYYGGRKVELNDRLSEATTSREPDIKYNFPKNHYSLLVMTDLDAPYPENPEKSPLLHWLVVNIRGDLDTGEVLANYKDPHPPPNSSLHRYLFEVYEQDGIIHAAPVANRFNFDVKKFAAQHKVILTFRADNAIRVGADTTDYQAGYGKDSVSYRGGHGKSGYRGGHYPAEYFGGHHGRVKPGYYGGHYEIQKEEVEYRKEGDRIREKTKTKYFAGHGYGGGRFEEPVRGEIIVEQLAPYPPEARDLPYQGGVRYRGGRVISDTVTPNQEVIVEETDALGEELVPGQQIQLSEEFVEPDEPAVVVRNQTAPIYYPRDQVVVERVPYVGGGKKYVGGSRRSKGPSHSPAAFCRATLHVEAKNDPSCESKNWPRGEGCYDPYAVAAHSVGTTVGRGTCAPYIDPKELDDSDFEAYIRLTNHKLRHMDLDLIPTDLSRQKTQALLPEYKQRLLEAEKARVLRWKRESQNTA